MSKSLEISISTGRFKKIREWNRRRNYYFKKLKLNVKIYVAKILWDKWLKNEFNINSVKTILLLRNEGTVGDVVVSTPLIKCLYESGYTVDLLVTKSSCAAVKYNPYIRTIYKADDCNTEAFLKKFNHTVDVSTIKQLNKNRYDLVIDLCLFDIPVHRMRLFKDINPNFVLGFNKWGCINHYSKSISFKNGKEHVTEAISLAAEVIGLKIIKRRSYDLHIPESVTNEVKAFLNSFGDGQIVIVNAFTGSLERDFSQCQLSEIIDLIIKEKNDVRLVILDHRQEITISLPVNAVINPFMSIHHVMALVHEADLIISPDTSIVHISAAWDKSIISVYKNVVDNNDLWAPAYENASQIIVNKRKISDVDCVPELILHEINRRGLL
ncbi:glycosyltransferase family 9 protein [Erwinia sp. S38]|uniref:glycosyltransferase family 9 protein n=1 Tax=Erwinia sp. S38 TaxID=2769338 RepID=UPI00190C70E1|nr:glycosyltransferase family 9 protein [Erwinia sp. S38]MBK0003579.1 glycosyltransferase family 9 protein [Erwinia sp. S38]